jgi:cytochrome c oxidase assembly protein subunit 11
MTERKSHRKIFIIGSIAAVVMFAFCFAIVPVYSKICLATGINTSVPTSQLTTPTTASKTVDLSREVTIQFVAMNDMGLPWDFSPQVKSVVVHPGENTKVFFHVRNTTTNQMVVQAIPSMTPTDAISHFHKIECFCFRQQTLAGRTSKEMPLIFNVDKDLPKEMHVITLAYTLFDVTPKVTTKKG